MGKNKNTIKSIEKTSFITSEKLVLGNITLEAGEVFSIDEKMALELMSSIFFKKGVIKLVKNEAK